MDNANDRLHARLIALGASIQTIKADLLDCTKQTAEERVGDSIARAILDLSQAAGWIADAAQRIPE